MRLAVLAARIAGVVVGLLIAAAGFFILWIELRVPPIHSPHVYLAAVMILIGGVAIAQDQLLGPLKKLLGLAAPYIPWKRPSVAVKPPLPDAKPVNDG